MYYVSVLIIAIDSKLYTVYTQDLKQRMENHYKGRVSSTRDSRLLELIYYEGCLHQSDATKREKYFKTYYGKMYLKKRLHSYLTPME